MATVRLTKLVLNNFGPYIGRHEVTFSPSGMVLIAGQNKDSQGASGSGKTFILHAIAYSLGFATLSAKDLQSWGTEDRMSVELHFDTAEGEAVLTRGSKLSLKVGNKVVKGAASAVEAEIDRLTGVSSKLRKMLTYRPQKSGGQFLTMKDSEKKEFFVDVLDLHWVEKGIEDSEVTLRLFKQDVAVKQGLVEAKQSYLHNLELTVPQVEVEGTTDLQLKVQEVTGELAVIRDTLIEHTEDLEVLQKEEEQAKEQIIQEGELRIQAIPRPNDSIQVVTDSEELKEWQKKLAECARLRTILEKSDAEIKAEVEAKIKQLQVSLVRLKTAAAKLPDLDRRRVEICKNIEDIQAGKCFTCSQTWVSEEKLKELQAELAQVEGAVQLAIGYAGEAEEVEKQLASTIFQPNPKLAKYDDAAQKIKVKIATEKEKLSQQNKVAAAERDKGLAAYRAIVAEVKASVQEKLRLIVGSKTNDVKSMIEGLRQEEAVCQSELSSLVKELSDKRLKNQKALLEKERYDADLAKAKTALSEAEAELDKISLSFNKERDFHGLLKGFLNTIFDEILDEITQEVNFMLSKLPNVGHLTLRFESETTTQQGNVKQTITPVVSFDGEDRPLSGCSGGMETSIELAVDLAVVAVVGRRKDTNLAFLSLDEAFTGLDSVSKEGCMEVLSQYADDRLVLVIDHSTEFKEMFQETITVVHENGTSRLAS